MMNYEKMPISCSMDPRVLVESFNRTRWLEKLRAAGASQKADGPEGPMAPVVTLVFSLQQKNLSHTSSLCWGPCKSCGIVLVLLNTVKIAWLWRKDGTKVIVMKSLVEETKSPRVHLHVEKNMGNSIQERHELTRKRESSVEPTGLNTTTSKASCIPQAALTDLDLWHRHGSARENMNSLVPRTDRQNRHCFLQPPRQSARTHVGSIFISLCVRLKCC